MKKSDMVTIHAMPTPFSFHRRTMRIEARGGETVRSAVNRAFPKLGLSRFAIGGVLADGDGEVLPGDTVTAWAMPRDPATVATIITVAKIVFTTITTVAAFASVGYSIYSYRKSKKMMKAAKNATYGKEVEDASDTNLGWDFDASNAVSEGAPLPVLYGRRYIIPPVIQQRSIVSPISGASYLEVIVGVAQGGAGFADAITYPPDKQGDPDVLLNHASWKNYISKSQFTNDFSETINRLDSGRDVYNGVRWENGTLHSYGPAQTTALNDGDTTTHGTDLASSQNYDSRTSPEGIGVKGSKYTRNFYFVLAQKCKITRVRVYTGGRHVTYRVYAGNSSNITEFRRIGASVSNQTKNSWKTCKCNTNGEFYQNVLLSDFASGGDQRYYEIEVYGSINTAESEGITGYAEVDMRPGGYHQEPFSICRGVWAALNINKGLNTSWFNFKSSVGASPDVMAVALEFPYGLYESGAQILSKDVFLACQWRGVKKNGAASAWMRFNSEFSLASATPADGNCVVKITDTATMAKSVQFQTDEGALSGYDHYEVRMKFDVDPGISSNVQAACNWTLLEEGYEHRPAYPKTAAVAVRMLATESLAGGAPQIKVMAERPYVMVFNSIDGEWEAKPASNPAWAAYDLLVRPLFDDTTQGDIEAVDPVTEEVVATPLFNEDTGKFAVDLSPFLRGEAFPHDRVRYSDFAAWADFCDEMEITMAMYFDGTSSVIECLQYVCDIGRAGIVNRGNIIGIVLDKAADALGVRNEPLPMFRFDGSNIVAGSYTESWRDRAEFPTEVQVTYYDKLREHSRKSVIARTDDAILNHNVKDVTLYCCDDIGVARRHAGYVLGMNALKRNFSWTGDLDSMPLDIGDLVSVNGNLATITGVTFDEELRRRFTAVNYAHERFGGWVKWTVGTSQRGTTRNTDSGTSPLAWYAVHGMPYKMQGRDFPAAYAGSGIYPLVYRVKFYAPGSPIITHEIVWGGEEWSANEPYIITTEDGGRFDVDFWGTIDNYSDSVALQPGSNLVCLSFDVPDWHRAYSSIGGVDYTGSVTPTDYVEFRNGQYTRHAIPTSGGILPLYTHMIYILQNTTGGVVNLPMFPPS